MPPENSKDINQDIDPYEYGYIHGERGYSEVMNMYTDPERQKRYEEGYEDARADAEYTLDELAVKAEERKRLGAEAMKLRADAYRDRLSSTQVASNQPFFYAKTGQPIVFSKTIQYE